MASRSTPSTMMRGGGAARGGLDVAQDGRHPRAHRLHLEPIRQQVPEVAGVVGGVFEDEDEPVPALVERRPFGQMLTDAGGEPAIALDRAGLVVPDELHVVVGMVWRAMRRVSIAPAGGRRHPAQVGS